MRTSALPRWVRDTIRILLVLTIFGTVAFFASLPSVREFFSIEHLRRDFQERGLTGYLIFISVGGLAVGLGIPRLWVSAIAGGLYGAVLGSTLGQIASMIGAVITFYIARILLRDIVLRRMPARMRIWYQRFNENGFRWLFYIRLFPIANATVTNLVGGISQVTFLQFLLATFLGYLPETIIFAVFGSSAAKKDYVQFAVAAVCLVLFIVGERLYQRYRKLRGGQDAGDEDAE